MPDTILTEDVDLVSGYLARPIADGSYTSIIVLQEWWGLDEHIRDLTRRFARNGFIALSPDLYHGKQTADPDEARGLSTGLDRTRATRDVISAADYLKNMDISNGSIFTIGYCMGGGISILTACNTDLSGAIVYYGGLPNPVEQLDELDAPVLAIYGSDETDRGTEIQQALTERGKEVDLHIYEGAKHAFFNDSWDERYDKNASDDSWIKVMDFIEKHS